MDVASYPTFVRTLCELAYAATWTKNDDELIEVVKAAAKSEPEVKRLLERLSAAIPRALPRQCGLRSPRDDS